MSTLYRHEVRDRTLVIWNCNSAMRNALSYEYYQGLLDGLARAAGDPAIAAVILAGEGGFFCSGGNLNMLKERRAMSFEERQVQIGKLNALIRAVRNCPKPVIAAVEGGAAGAGLSLAMAADMIVAEDGAKFTLAYVKAGLVPDGGATYALTQALPRATVARMAMLAEPLSAERMHQLGAVTELAPKGRTLAQAEALTDAVARGPEIAIADIKKLLNQAETASFEDQLDHERDAMAKALGGDEAQAGIGAFLSKTSPVFR
ncbi:MULTISPECIES: oxepin-CoA hydrolase, alternative type [unclassified Leisingera]|uniref:oxepin-CoA hydrolase, alternative type n=1 Tax=unclassified Leisingera TaxID=2614906 RepID=UPI0003195E77|nr:MULTISPECIES: enoyl-CoA hydratase family protein [unclassified Leisingera]KIC14557.1 enoyl-CoA hydratase [Leisingera sp. ANG-DT]KIC24042.1 enoyl-CoA hydratase [Leisingera sp. ANG-S3]KIC52532.1 enoyl-CoA hydratase [Leisingera sp. ANG-S]KID09830.1 enoyl-CoA hydratase [Leisingera sp. ANG1]